jgi:hypothetical protein
MAPTTHSRNLWRPHVARPIKQPDWAPEFRPGEWEQVAHAYAELLGLETLEHFKFAPFMHELHPESLKRYRLFVDTVTQGVGLEDPLPAAPIIMMTIGHYYCSIRYPQGIFTDLGAVKVNGGRKQDVADLLALAWLHSGPFGMNVAAGVSDTYMRLWDDDSGAPGIDWPEGWEADPQAFRCGIDFAVLGDGAPVAGEQVALVEEWYRRVQGEVPRWVTFMGKHYPLALMAFRARYETSAGGSLPVQMVALCQVHLSASWMRPEALRRALHMARHFRVAKAHVLQVLALAQLYLGDVGMDAAIDVADNALDRWDGS